MLPMKKEKTFCGLTLRLSMFIIAVAGLVLASCNKEDDENDIYRDFPNQNIPSVMCGTWKEVMCGREFFYSMTINPDGKTTAEYYSIYDGGPIVLKGKCYYKKGIIKFYYEYYDGHWANYPMGVEIDGDYSVPFFDCTPSTLVLSDNISAHFMSRDDNIPTSYQGTDRPAYMIGGWKHNSGGHAMDLSQDGTGTVYYTNQTADVENWFVWNGHFYIKNTADDSYEVFQIVRDGNVHYLYISGTSDWMYKKE